MLYTCMCKTEVLIYQLRYQRNSLVGRYWLLLQLITLLLADGPCKCSKCFRWLGWWK